MNCFSCNAPATVGFCDGHKPRRCIGQCFVRGLTANCPVCLRRAFTSERSKVDNLYIELNAKDDRIADLEEWVEKLENAALKIDESRATEIEALGLERVLTGRFVELLRKAPVAGAWALEANALLLEVDQGIRRPMEDS